MSRHELVVPSEVPRIRELYAAGKPMQEICRLSRRSRWTVRRILTNRHPACKLRESHSPSADYIRESLAPDSTQKADSLAPAIQVGSDLEVGAMIVTREIIVEKFFNEVVVHFPLGRTRPKDKFVAGLVAALIADRVTEPVLEEAAFLAIGRHKGRFPAVSLCREFCTEARTTLRGAGRGEPALIPADARSGSEAT